MGREAVAPRTRVKRALALTSGVAVAVAALVLAPAGGQGSSARVLHQLATLSDSQADAFLSAHPERLLELLNSVPKQAARDWPLLPATDRSDLERIVPDLVGNLDGVSYAIRDRANRRTLARELSMAQLEVRADRKDRSAQQSLAAYKAIHAALYTKTVPRRHLVELVPGVQPTAAISIGALDTAPMVTWTVPGMGTYTTDMQLWTLAAQNIWDAQRDAAAPPGHAVVAWIGYATPPVGIDAALGDYATNGAPDLTEAIEGLTAYRRDDLPIVNVVAHSYGTTMVADALADTVLGISSFVMLGSAGVEERISTAADLHALDVYAGEAAADTEARLGRASRFDPKAPAFGAQLLPVDGDRASGLLPVTQHAPILHSAYNDDITSAAWAGVPASVRETAYKEHMAQHGYLDIGTQSLREVGLATATARTPTTVTGKPTTLSTNLLAGGITLRPLQPGE